MSESVERWKIDAQIALCYIPATFGVSRDFVER